MIVGVGYPHYQSNRSLRPSQHRSAYSRYSHQVDVTEPSLTIFPLSWFATLGQPAQGVAIFMSWVPKSDRKENGTVTFKERMLPYLSFRAALHDQIWRENWSSQFMRPGLLLIAVFQIASIAASAFLFHNSGRYFPFEIFNAVAAVTCLWFLWASRFEHQWRTVAFSFCLAILIAASYLSFITHRTEPLLMAVMLLLFGAGSLVPWSARWKSALTIVCLGWFTINALWLPGHQPDSLDRWLALLAAAGLAPVGTARNEHQRKEVASRVKLIANQPAS